MSEARISKTAFLAVTMGFVFYCYEYLLRISPSVMQSELMEYFKINATMFGTLSAFYYYSYTPMQLVVGALVDKYEIKKILVLSTIMCVIGTMFIAWSNSYVMASTGRFLQGLGSAFAWVSILKLGVLFLPKKWLGFVSGVGSVFGFLGAAAGQIAMGYAVQSLGWKEVLSILAITGIPLIFLFYFILKKATLKLNINITIINTTAYGWWIRFLIVIRKPQVWSAGFIAALLFLPTIVFAELWGVNYISKLYGYSPAQASFVTAMIFVGWAIGALFMGIISIFFQNRLALMRIGVILALIFSLIILYVPLTFGLLCLCCILFGMTSAVQVLTFPMGLEVVAKKISGIAGAFVNFLCMLGGMLFQRIAGQILDFEWSGQLTSNGVRVYSIHDYKIAASIIPISLTICAVFICILKIKENRHIISGKNIFMQYIK